ncbi:glycosyltransferase family 20-domain-containing protein [Hyaloraphidium curvatum]|nr:glycosyltransferase family 20-domain-containing protein [Hyaloraphidium curvatum]
MPPDLIEELKKQLWLEYKYVPVILEDKVATGSYEGYCKTHLYPLLHYVMMDIEFDGAAENRNWDDYVAMSRKFAETIAATMQDNDLVWLHDYHLFLIPAMLRELRPAATIGFFLHTPFPSSEIFRCGPRRKQILEGVLGSQLIGFQTYSYARHFISSCTRVLGLESSPRGVEYNGNLVEVRIVPVGIDVNRVERRRKMPAVLEKMQSIREMYPGKKIIVGRDKLDQVKGVAHKLASFEKFLRLYPEFQNKVVLIQVTTPPQREIPRLEAKFAELVARINGHFGSLEFAPVHHYHQLNLDRDEYYALLSIADVGLVTALRDGMNTTSHEFIVCQQENKSPLILSEFTGTAGSLGSSIMVNPWDHLGCANAIYEALTMSKEDKIARHQQLYNHVINQTAQVWGHQFVRELRSCHKAPEVQGPVPMAKASSILGTYRGSARRLLIFDYDGTLTPIRKTPGEAVPPAKMLTALTTLVLDPANYVFVVSGRDRAALEEWLGHIPGLGLCAEHGCFIRWPGDWEWVDVTQEVGLDLSWKEDVRKIFDYYTERTQGSFVELKSCAVTWHYRLSDPDFGSFQAKECQNHLENAILSKLPVDILLGKKNLEVRPSMINKGEMVKRLLARDQHYDFIMCAGDDRTDEDMFKSIRAAVESQDHVYTIYIGDAGNRTQAMYRLPNPEALINILGYMAAVSTESIKQIAARHEE